MTTSSNGRKLIESFESLSLKAYRDQRGIATLGWGHTLGVQMGDTCTAEQADQWLAEDLAVAEHAVNQIAVPLDQNQYDSLVSLCFNIGASAFLHSTLVSLLQQKAYAGASAQFLSWTRTDGNINAGLQRRRKAEKSLFDSASA